MYTIAQTVIIVIIEDRQTHIWGLWKEINNKVTEKNG
jgi:hypothetical protein